ncbi:MAG: cupin domain-containing protein [Acetivibrionales bacterium]
MIKKQSKMIREIREQMRGGKGNVEINHIFKEDELNGKCRLFAKITLNEGCSIGLHEHDDEEEIYYIMKGKAMVEDNGVKQELSAGDAVLTGGGASHYIENIGDEALEIMAVILLY